MMDAVRPGVTSRSRVSPALYPAVVAACVVGAFVLAREPFLAAGVGFGGLFVAFVLLRPLLAITLMMLLGLLDLSFVTGGFKSLLPDLGGIDMNGIRLVGMVSGLALLALSDARVRARIFGSEGRWYLMFLAWAGLGIAASMSPNEGLRLLFKMAYPLLLFAVVLGMASTRHELDRLVDAALIGATIITVVLNPVLALEGGYSVDQYGVLRVMGVGAHSNPFSFYLLAMLLLAFMRFVVRRQIRYLLLSGVFSAWLVLTVSRISFLAAMVALLALAVSSALFRRDWKVLGWTLALGGLVAVLFLPPVLERTFWGRMPTLGEVVTLLIHPVQLYETINMEGRQVLWAILLRNFMNAPVTGLGMGSSSAILARYFNADAALVAHNEYIRLLVDTGIIGLGLFAVAVTRWFVHVVRAGAADDPTVRELAGPAVGLIAAWVVISLTDNPLDYYSAFTQFVGVVCAGAIAAAGFARVEEGEAAERVESAGREPVSAGVGRGVADQGPGSG